MRGVQTNLVLLLAALALSGTQAEAQTTPPPVRSSLELGMRASQLKGATEFLWGGAALIHPFGRISIGGAGWIMVGSSDVDGTNAGSDLELTFGYAGALVDVLVLESAQSRLSARALIGAGNAKVLVPVVGPEIGADNFGVVEPSLNASRRLFGWIHLEASAAYRFVYGVEDLPEVLAQDLRGASVSLGLGLRRP